MTTSKRTLVQSGFSSVGGCDLCVFIFVVVVNLVKQNDGVCHSFHVEQDTSGGVLGYGAAVDAYAGAGCSVGFEDLFDLGEELLELGRPSELDGVRSCRDEEIGVFKGRELAGLCDKFLVEEVEGDCAGDGFAGGLIAGQCYCDHCFLICNDSRYPSDCR